MKNFTLAILCCLLTTTPAIAALALDRTRVVYEGTSAIETIKIRNSSDSPFLAQSWLTDLNGKELQDKFAVVPPVLRIESNDYAILRIRSLPTSSLLPQDRESAFFLHVREVPPSTENKGDNAKPQTTTGSIQIAVESVIKFFYRPDSLSHINRIDKAIASSTRIQTLAKDKIILENGSPFYVTYSDLTQGKKMEASGFKPIMLPPFSSKTLDIKKNERYQLSHINDYGATVTNAFYCRSTSICVAQVKKD